MCPKKRGKTLCAELLAEDAMKLLLQTVRGAAIQDPQAPTANDSSSDFAQKIRIQSESEMLVSPALIFWLVVWAIPKSISQYGYVHS